MEKNKQEEYATTFTTSDNPTIVYIEGDGTGPDIWKATVGVLNAAVKSAYGGKRHINWVEALAGEKAKKLTGEWLPSATLDAIRKHKVAIKGPLSTPVGGGIRSLNVAIRHELQLYACIRPVRYIHGVPSPLRYPEKINMVVFRENMEDVYAGIEWEAGSEDAERMRRLLREEYQISLPQKAGIGIKFVSEDGTKKLVRRAIKFAIDTNRRSVTIMHKGNIMKFTEGAFRKWGYEVAKEEFGESVITEEEAEKSYGGNPPAGKVIIKDRIADAMFQMVLLRPEEYDVIACPNLNGDYLSDALAAMVGGLGMSPGANVGDDVAVFEATHGSAPKYAGLDKVNPSSLILSGSLMFEYIGWKEASELVYNGIIKAVAGKEVTYDLARQIADAKEVPCSVFANRVIQNIL